MVATTSTITGPVTFGDTSEATFGKLLFELTTWDYETGESFYVSGPFAVDISVDGNFSIELFTNDAGVNNSSYKVSVAYRNGLGKDVVNELGYIFLTGPGPIKFADLGMVPTWIPNMPDLLTQLTGYVATAENSAATALADRIIADADVVLTNNDVQSAGVILQTVTTLSNEMVATIGALTTDDIPEGTTDNKYISTTEKTKLGNIEAAATTDQSGSEIKTKYENESDTNAFTDLEKTKLTNIATGAEAIPNRLGEYAKTITDWNDAVTNGWFMGNDATNAPTAGVWYIGNVVAHNDNWCLQEVYSFTSDNDVDTKAYRREKNSNPTGWGSWTKIKSTQTEITTLIDNLMFPDSEKYVHGNGQSNMLNKYVDDISGNTPPVETNADVIVQRGDTLAWTANGEQWDQIPHSLSAPHGSGLIGGAPNQGLSFCHKAQRELGGKWYYSRNARSGRSIEEWTDNGVLSNMFVEDKVKIEAALATPELSGLTYITAIVRDQLEEDYNHEWGVGDTYPLINVADYINNYEVYRCFKDNMNIYLANLKTQAWWGPDSILIVTGGSDGLHNRYMPGKALRDFARENPEVRYVSADGLTTRTDLADFTHFDGPSIHKMGEMLYFDAFTQQAINNQNNSDVGSIFTNRIGGPFTRGDDTIVLPSEAVLEANFSKLATPRKNTLHIAAGLITITDGYHAVGTEGSAATDDLTNILGGIDGMRLLLDPESSSEDITFKHLAGGVGQIRMIGGADQTFLTTRGLIELVYRSRFDEWSEIRFNAD